MTKWSLIVGAIQDLHAPIVVRKDEDDFVILCNHCKVKYPCNTVRLIDDAIGK